MHTAAELARMTPAELMAALLADRAETLKQTGDDLADDLRRLGAAHA